MKLLLASVSFTGVGVTNNYDVNLSSVPRGGVIVSVGETTNFGYQPLVAAGGTAIVSAAGTITSVSIGNSGSGYRVGLQTNILVRARYKFWYCYNRKGKCKCWFSYIRYNYKWWIGI